MLVCIPGQKSIRVYHACINESIFKFRVTVQKLFAEEGTIFKALVQRYMKCDIGRQVSEMDGLNMCHI